MIQIHKVFISYHHANDQKYRDAFESFFAEYYNIMISKSVQIGDIEAFLKTDTIRQKIRDEYLRDSTVTVVLVGTETWKRKHVDWEISSSIRETTYSSRSGLVGILLPTHPSYGRDTYDAGLLPPRLYDNQVCGYAKIYDWNNNPSIVQKWIHQAYLDRSTVTPDNSYPHFVNNKSGERWK
jgi:hypothetical protein